MAAAKKPAQGLLEDMLDEETVERLKDRQAEDTFELVELITPDYRCPRCAYEWRGNPMPPAGVSIEDDAEDGDGK